MTDRSKNSFLYPALIVILLAIIGFGSYRFYVTAKENIATKTQLEGKIAANEKQIAQLQNDRTNLQVNLANEQNINNGFSSQINRLTGTVGTLQKLSQTDPELLKKYSKVYFLSENYVPDKLSNIDSQFLLPGTKALLINNEVVSFLQRLLADANSNGLSLKVLSAFRSFGVQSSLKSNYKVTYGAGTANSFSADQGYSEHQLGTAVDFTTTKEGATLDVILDKSPEFTWLVNNAYRYGFSLSYPKSNSYYTYEPWHWRFVGIKLATYLHSEGKFFNDLDQRQIDSYLINLFDPQ